MSCSRMVFLIRIDFTGTFYEIIVYCSQKHFVANMFIMFVSFMHFFAGPIFRPTHLTFVVRNGINRYRPDCMLTLTPSINLKLASLNRGLLVTRPTARRSFDSNLPDVGSLCLNKSSSRKCLRSSEAFLKEIR